MRQLVYYSYVNSGDVERGKVREAAGRAGLTNLIPRTRVVPQLSSRLIYFLGEAGRVT